MRALAVAIVVAGCGGNGSSGGACTQDAQCDSDDVCAANGLCWSADSVRNARIQWTVGGQPASAASCSSIPNLDMYFTAPEGDSSEDFGYAPVPCAEGVFTELKLPDIYTDVQFLDDVSQAPLGEGTIGGTASTSVDLEP
jgi:hypothetical protein